MKSKYVIFKLDKDICALDVQNVLEIIELDNMIKTNTKELNVVSWEDKSIPVVDPDAMMTFEYHCPTVDSRIIIVKKKGMEFGILVNYVAGIIEFEDHLIEDPVINENKYVSGVIDGDIKVFAPEAFLTPKMKEKFEDVYALELHYLEEGIKIHGKRLEGRDAVIEDIRLKTLNMLIQGTKSHVGHSFIKNTMEIHELISLLK